MAQSGEKQVFDLLEKAKTKSFIARPIMGFVRECSTLVNGTETIYAVSIENGPLSEAFFLAGKSPEGALVFPPLVGDRVKGVVNTFDDKVDFADQRLKPIFDFKNETRANEESHFAWFREQEYLAKIGSPAVSPVYKKSNP